MELAPFLLLVGLLAGLIAGRWGWLTVPAALAFWGIFWVVSGGDPYGDGTVSPIYWVVSMAASATCAAVGLLLGIHARRGLVEWRRRSAEQIRGPD
jgi:uncharacterized membrane protein YfcA